MFIIYIIITYTLQDPGIKHTIYVHVHTRWILVYIQLVDLCSTQNKKQESIHTENVDEKQIN